MSVSSSDPETTSASAPARTPFLRLLPFALVTFLTVCASAFSLYLSPAILMTASQVLASGPGGPGWP